MSDLPRIVADGRDRLRKAIRAEVTAEYADQLAGASRWRRLFLVWRIRAEVERRLQRSASRGACHLRS